MLIDMETDLNNSFRMLDEIYDAPLLLSSDDSPTNCFPWMELEETKEDFSQYLQMPLNEALPWTVDSSPLTPSSPNNFSETKMKK